MCGMYRVVHVCVECTGWFMYVWNVPGGSCMCGMYRGGSCMCGMYRVVHVFVGCTGWFMYVWNVPGGSCMCGMYRVVHVCVECTGWFMYVWNVLGGSCMCGMYRVVHVFVGCTGWFMYVWNLPSGSCISGMFTLGIIFTHRVRSNILPDYIRTVKGRPGKVMNAMKIIYGRSHAVITLSKGNYVYIQMEQIEIAFTSLRTSWKCLIG